MDFRTYLLVSFPINFYVILWLINLLFKWTFPDALWRSENKHHIQNILLSFAQTVNVVNEQLLTRCPPLSSDEILLEILLCMFRSIIKNGPDVYASFLCLHGWCPQAILCASLRDHLGLFSTCMCVCVARSYDHVSYSHRTEAAHLANVCVSPAFWECCVRLQTESSSLLHLCVCLNMSVCGVVKGWKEPPVHMGTNDRIWF